MASLSLSKWARYEPSIPGNLELPVEERFYLEVAAGLSVARFQRFTQDVQGSTNNSQLAAAFEGLVRLGTVTLALDGEEIRTPADYLAAILCQRGMPLLAELTEKIGWLNSYTGSREVFCVRPSGGSASTLALKTEPGSGQTVAP